MTDEKVKRTYEQIKAAIEKACEGYVFDELSPEAKDRYNRECIKAVLESEVFDVTQEDTIRLESLLQGDRLLTEVDLLVEIIPKVPEVLPIPEIALKVIEDAVRAYEGDIFDIPRVVIESHVRKHIKGLLEDPDVHLTPDNRLLLMSMLHGEINEIVMTGQNEITIGIIPKRAAEHISVSVTMKR